MIFAIVDGEKEQQRLDNAIKEAKDKGLYRRLMVIKLSSQGKLIRHIKKEFGICEATIRSYIHRYNKYGLDSLRPKKPTGRPPKIAHWSKRDWDRILAKSPYYYEKLKTDSEIWTLELIAKYLVEYHNIKVCISSIYNALRKIRNYKVQKTRNSSNSFIQAQERV
ncbi:TPA: helix-turn-helix domain-containing protein [bacterium]|nr:helix-turn-helix domain-containing protein [bacterium]